MLGNDFQNIVAKYYRTQRGISNTVAAEMILSKKAKNRNKVYLIIIR